MKKENIQSDFNFCRPLDFQKKIDVSKFRFFFKKLLFKKNDISQKHILFLVTELYSCWNESEEQFLAVSMSKRGYRAKSRYNPNKISSHLILAIRLLKKEGLIDFYPGFFDVKKKVSRLSRIRASKDLINEFKKINLNFSDFLNIKTRETIFLLDKKNNLVEYKDDFFTHEAREVLINYNYNLSKTFFDIACVEKPFFIRGDNAKVPISHFCCINKIVFKETWRDGGVFGGSWWSKIDPFSFNKLSSHMLINDEETSYVDLMSIFSTLLSFKSEIHLNDIETELTFLKKKTFFIKNLNQLSYLIVKAINSKTLKGFFRSFCIDRKKIGIKEKVSQKEFEIFLDDFKKFSPKLFNLINSKHSFNWNSIVSDIFYGLMKNFGTSNIPAILVLDKIFYPTKIHNNVTNYLYNFISKYSNHKKIQLKFQKCYAYNFGEKSSIFESLIGNNLKYSNRFLENKKKFRKVLINN